MGKKIIEVEFGNEDQFFKNDEDDQENDYDEISEDDDPIIKDKNFKNSDRQVEIKQKIDEIRTDFRKRMKVSKIPWHEHMSIVSDQKVAIQKQDINDDIQREVQFYNITLSNVKLALQYLENEGISLERPDDYMAEMYKSDKQMNKIKGKLVRDKERIQYREEQELRMQSKKLQKKIQVKREQEKQRLKKKNLAAIGQWKQEIKEKGDKAKDLSQFLLQKQDFSKGGNGKQGQGRDQADNRGRRGKFDNQQEKGGRKFQRGGGQSDAQGQRGGAQKFNKSIKKSGGGGGNNFNKKGGKKKGKSKRVGKVQRSKNKSKKGGKSKRK